MSVNLFGRSYESAGSSSADFLIKTKGKVKIQYGSKFIDLIKDGKINVDAKFIYKEKEVGVKDGIYVIGDGEESRVILLINGVQIDLKGEIGTTYVSFLEEQKTTSDNKYTALTNIGFIYKDLDSISDDSLKNGLIYVESEKKLYIISDGKLSEYVVNIPNPYTKQFVIAKSDDEKGAILIRGEGISNSLALDTMYIYSLKQQTYLDSKGNLVIAIDGQEKIVIEQDSVTILNRVMSSIFSSIGASESTGFRLYVDESNGSTLEVDNLIVRNSTGKDTYMNIVPQYWHYLNNIISSAQLYSDESVEDSDYQYILQLIYNNEFTVEDKLYVYIQYKSEDVINRQLIALNVLEVDGNSIRVSINQDIIPLQILDGIDTDDLLQGFIHQTLFLVGNDSKLILPKTFQYGLDIIESTSFSNESNPSKVLSRVGDLTNLGLKIQDKDITGGGVYSRKLFAKQASYIDGYKLEDKDKSPNFASTEWVQKYIDNLLPSGSIIMFNGQADSIPNGWAICNGQNGTPNLIGKFVKASASAGEIGGKSEIELTVDNLPKHSHSIPANSGSTSSNGSHLHTFIGIDASTIEVQEGKGSTVVSKVSTTSQNTSSNGSHSHSVSVDGSNTEYAGSGTPLKWEPTYYSLIYIMKL